MHKSHINLKFNGVLIDGVTERLCHHFVTYYLDYADTRKLYGFYKLLNMYILTSLEIHTLHVFKINFVN